MTTRQPIGAEPVATRGSGFRGPKDARFWTKDSKYGVKYQCTSCGRVTLGIYGTGDGPEMHRTGCARVRP